MNDTLVVQAILRLQLHVLPPLLRRSNGPRILHISAPRLAVVVALGALKQFSVIEVVPELYVKAGTKDDAEKLEDWETEPDGAQDYQVVLRRLQKFINAALVRQK